MALTKETAVDQITVTENGCVLVRKVTRVFEDGVELSKNYHRTSLAPGEDISTQEPRVQGVASAVWTQEVIDAYNAQQVVPSEKA
jgi:archaellum component FlaF (FlaF/FlaG flagellin family)